jgi:hypothetical protein
MPTAQRDGVRDSRGRVWRTLTVEQAGPRLTSCPGQPREGAYVAAMMGLPLWPKGLGVCALKLPPELPRLRCRLPASIRLRVLSAAFTAKSELANLGPG